MARTLWQRLLDPPLPQRLSGRFRTLDDAATRALVEALERHYFASKPDGYLATDAGRVALHDHVAGRLEHDRRRVIPWLDRARRLDGARVLEIGCGTGASTVALAEQGASVVGLDLDEPSLAVARVRCAAAGVEADLRHENAVRAHEALAGRRFDFVIFYASLEHMTLPERLDAIRTTWTLVEPGGFWGVIECPNRLWYFDAHSAELPFYLWLPPDLAIAYARFSPRAEFREAFADAKPDDATRELLARWGRGASYHELEVALGRATAQRVHSSKESHRRATNPAAWLRWRVSAQSRRQKTLQAHHRGLSAAYFEPQLNLLLQAEGA